MAPVFVLLKEKLIMQYTPPMVLKAAKNGAEISGFKNSTVRRVIKSLNPCM